MKTTEVKFYPKRALTEAQQQRIDSHQASIKVNADGTLDTSVRTIITPRGDVKEVAYKSIRPDQAERVMKTGAVYELFEDLQHMNLIVTNACNLSCSYCYEQHDKDYGRFTPESLKQLYDFLVACNPKTGKLFQFFGGEPLIHKQLILDFLRTYDAELKKNSATTAVGIITNGILLTPQFIDEYFQSKHVCMSVSLDTDIAEIDHREIGQDRIDRIIDMIGLIPEYHKNNHMVSVRCTIAIENAPRLVEFCTRLYDKGLRAIVIHPLTNSSVDGHLTWDAERWEALHQSVLTVINTLPNFEVQFSEGVGAKGGNNCMVGSDMIAVDASGDFSGCHFFTNLKESVPHTILGNLLHDAVYVDRYASFQDIYNEMFIKEPQCQACDLKGFCYQCPAGQADTGRGLFRPDAMCQSIVRLFLELQNDIVRKTFNQKFQQLVESVATKGEQYTFAKALTHLMYNKINRVHLAIDEVDQFADKLPPYEQIIGQFIGLMENKVTALDDADDYVPTITAWPIDIKALYEYLLTAAGKPVTASVSEGDINDVNKRTFYLALVHMVLLNQKGDGLSKPHKIVKL
jgi:radical SAM protein with 4Fe4S-binding SPASM domain